MTPGVCPACEAPTLSAKDVDTPDTWLLDAAPVDDGSVLVWAGAGDRPVCRRYGKPARVQPAHRIHQCGVAA